MRLPLIVALVVAPTLALADGDDMTGLDPRTQEMATSLKPDARAHFIAASKAFNAQDYKTSSPEYEAAYKLDPEVPLLMSWAQSERLGGNCPRALELYQKYLYSEINERQAEFTRQRIKECGGVVPTKAVPPPVPPPKPIVVEPSYVWYKDYPADGLVGAGVIGLLVGTIYFVKANNAVGVAETTMQLTEYRQAKLDVDHDNKIDTGGMIIGGALALAGVGVYIYHSQTQHGSMAVTTDGQTISFATRW
jgi:hypothetical protein